MRIHFCFRDEDGAPRRIYVHTRTRVWIIGEKSQVYENGTYTDRWAFITWRPK